MLAERQRELHVSASVLLNSRIISHRSFSAKENKNPERKGDGSEMQCNEGELGNQNIDMESKLVSQVYKILHVCTFM